MKPSLSSLVMFSFTGALAVAATGCFVNECKEGDVCVEGETGIRYEGNEASTSIAYAAGSDVVINGVNGDITVGIGGSDIAIAFEPFTMERDSAQGQENAENELGKLLILEVTAGNPNQITVRRADGASGYLGANVRVTLPSSFSGDLDVQQGNGTTEIDLGSASPRSTTVFSENGSIECLGATGPLDIYGDNGDITVSVSTWAKSGDGRVYADHGDVSFSLPAEATGALSLYAPDGGVSATLPADWTEDAVATNSVTYTMGDGDGAHVTVTAASQGSITAEAY